MNRLCALLLVTFAAVGAVRAEKPDPAVVAAEAERIAVMARAREAAVAIFPPGGGGGGSGVLISADGYALSNFHVTNGAGNAMKCGLSDGQLYDAVIVGFDPVGDVALIKLLGRDDFPHAELGDSDRVQVGDWAFAVGNPFLLANDFSPSVSYGIISGTHRYQYPSGTLLEYTDCLQTDASINPGNSGGPLFDAAGKVIGINGRGSFEKRGRVNVGVGYAISINQIKNFLGHLKGGRIVDHATLGARVSSRGGTEVAVTDILDDSDAFRRGLRTGDEVVAFAGRPIRTVNAFKNVLGIFPKDWSVPLSYRREGKTYDVVVRLEGLHSPEELLQKISGRVPSEDQPERPKRDEPGKPGREKPDSPPHEDGHDDTPSDTPDAPHQDTPENQQPDDEQPKGEKPGVPPRQRLPMGWPGAQTPEMPAEVKAVFETRRGFANYYFNKLERDRTWERCAARGDFRAVDGEWTLKGELARGGDVEFRLDPSAVVYIMPGTVADGVRLPVGEDLTELSDPPGSGGMLAALLLWRRMMVLGPADFGNVQYLGTVPLMTSAAAAIERRPGLARTLQTFPAGAAELSDALVGAYGGVETRFVFDSQTGNLAVLELDRGTGEDPCELHFGDYAELEGRVFPREIEVRNGASVYATLKLNDIKLGKAEGK